MRSQLLRPMFLLAAAAMLSLAGCSDGRDEPLSTNDALAKIKQSRVNSEPLAIPQPEVPEASEAADMPEIETTDVPKTGVFTVKVESSAGDYKIEVHRDWSPIGAERFYQLVKAGYYDECRYFRVVPGFMVQFGISGDPAVQREWNRNIKDDAVKESNVRGYVTFAKTGAPNSRTTQIFISYGDNKFLDSDGFSPFGKVTEGMDHVDAINSKYGESPEQGRIEQIGNDYLKQSFPELDYVKKMSIMSEPTGSPSEN